MADTVSIPALHIEFQDGTSEDIRLERPELHLAFRRAQGRKADMEDIADLFHLAYIRLGQPNGSSETGLEDWMKTIFTFEHTSVELPRPTKARTTSSKE